MRERLFENFNGMKLLGRIQAYKLAFDESGNPLGVALTYKESFADFPAHMHVRVESGVTQFKDGDGVRVLVKPSTNNTEQSMETMEEELENSNKFEYEGNLILTETRRGYDVLTEVGE